LFYLSQLVAKSMVAQQDGVMIHVSSNLAQQAIPGRPAYIATKGAVESLTRAMALELAPSNVRVVAVAPGVVHTSLLPGKGEDHDLRTELEQLVPLSRLADPGEVGATIKFLA
jgi:3-oxoacyl-[acyl-carrier protein] reductase